MGEEIDRVAREVRTLSPTMREYLVFGPYPHWTGTRRAVERRGLAHHLFSSERHPERGSLTEFGKAVAQYLKDHPHG